MKNKFLLGLNLALLIVALVMMQYKPLTDRYYVSDDVRNLFFVNNFEYNIENSLLAQYSYGKWINTTIYLSSFYIFINKLVDFIFVTKLMSILTFLMAVIFAYKLGKAIKDTALGLILAFLFMLQPWSIQPFSGGLSRSFAFPLVMAFLYYLIRKDTVKSSTVIVLQAILYPPALLISLLTFGISLIDLKSRKINISLKRNYIVYISAAVSLSIVLMPMVFVNYGIKEQISLNEAILSRDFYEGGRLPIFMGEMPFTSDVSSAVKTLISMYNPGIYDPLHNSPLFMLLLLVLISIAVYRKKVLALPKEVYLLLVSSFVMQSLAFILLFRLHLPSRYIRYTLPVFLLIVLAYGLYMLYTSRRARYLFFASIFLLSVFYIPKIDDRVIRCGDEKLYGYMQTLPKESLIAGFPNEMNCLSLYGQKQPFITSELSYKYHIDYYSEVSRRTLDFFSAYYSNNKQTVQEFCSDNGVTHIVVNKEHFDANFLNKKMMYYKPFNTHIKNITQNRKDFYLQKPDDVLFESGNKMVISCGALVSDKNKS